ncbi:MAG: 6-phosphogluconolactonase [Eubacteriales bacterium]|nr:6-phosphogluconolactonase [Eubacteriales bacterium]
MQIIISESRRAMGRAAAVKGAEIIGRCIREKGNARIVLSTGASQFELFNALKETGADWSKTEVFHLDEYIGLPVTHKASFRKYLKERFVDVMHPGRMHYVMAEGDIKANISNLSRELLKEPIDLGFIGIGENAHIAFNDPPADFNTQEPYIVVELNDSCKRQQVREGWFDTFDDVPEKAVTMSVHRIMQCRSIISFVPGEVKAKAVRDALTEPVTPAVPAAILRNHNNVALYLDNESAALIIPEIKDGKYEEKDVEFNV